MSERSASQAAAQSTSATASAPSQSPSGAPIRQGASYTNGSVPAGVVTGVLAPVTLGRLRAIQAQIVECVRARDEVFAIYLEGLGHDPALLALTDLDVGSGAFTAGPRTPGPSGA